MPRLDWKEYALKLAEVAKLRSEDPYMQVGACALDANNRVLGCAYNGLPSGKIVTPDFWEDRDARRPYMIHAEVNLLSLFKRGEAVLVASTLLPCTSCAQALAAHGVKEIVFNEVYNRDVKAIELFDFYGIKLTQIKP